MSNLNQYFTQNVCKYLEQTNDELIRLRQEVKDLVKICQITGNMNIIDYEICDECDMLLRNESESWLVCECSNCNHVVCNECSKSGEEQDHKIYRDTTGCIHFLCPDCTDNHIKIPASWNLMHFSS